MPGPTKSTRIAPRPEAPPAPRSGRKNQPAAAAFSASPCFIFSQLCLPVCEIGVVGRLMFAGFLSDVLVDLPNDSGDIHGSPGLAEITPAGIRNEAASHTLHGHAAPRPDQTHDVHDRPFQPASRRLRAPFESPWHQANPRCARHSEIAPQSAICP